MSDTPYHELFNELFDDDDYSVIEVKVTDLPEDYDISNNGGCRTMVHGADIVQYLKDSGVNILASSAGLHINGENKKPHLHYHFITGRYTPNPNPSQHRKRWMTKVHSRNLDGCSFRYTHLKKDYPAYQVLSYPLKEGYLLNSKQCYVFNSLPMEKTMLKFLKDTGHEIYSKQLALRERQDRCDERKKVALNNIFDFAEKGHKENVFSNIDQLLEYMEEEYLGKLNLIEIPDFSNYKNNIYKVALKLKLIKYKDLIK